MEVEEFQHLWKKYLEKKATEQEIIRLLHFIRDGKADGYLEQYILHLPPESYQQVDLPQNDWDQLWQRVRAETHPGADTEPEEMEERPRGRVLGMIAKYGGWAVAASVLIVLAINNVNNKKEKTNATQEIARQEALPNDRKAPSSVNAVLTLANGKTIVLDSVNNGEVASQGGADIIKMGDGRLMYNAFDPNIKEVQYNTLTVPRGSRIVELVLGDGSTVVLNAASSITYPTAFTGTERVVEMTGEVYFEIARNIDKPFIVKNGKTRVEVLGTHFNVNAYDDEGMTNVTLLEGSVKVSQLQNSRNLVLKPGQAATVNEDIRLMQNVDIDEVMAWKSGKFKFGEYASMGTVMRQISRWYDVEVEYAGDVKGHIGGTISREANVSQVLELLEMTGVVKFKYDGKKIIVMQNR